MDLNQLSLLLTNQPLLLKTTISDYKIDSRLIEPNDVFIAIEGENHDGHAFINDALNRGAIAAIVSKNINPSLDTPLIKVPDTLSALATIASKQRQQFIGTLIAITGSAGKTTVKEMIASILRGSFSILSTSGNFNNHIGAPLILSRLNNTYDHAVIELGANHVGEILYTTKIAQPNISVITNVFNAHIGEFGSLENIIKAKSEILQETTPNGLAILNADDTEILSTLLNNCDSLRVRTFGQKHGDFIASNVELSVDFSNFTVSTPKGNIDIHLPIPGMHNISNALAAISATYDLVSLQTMYNGLNKMHPYPGRLNKKNGINGSYIIDDTYNASPSSVIAALKYLAMHPGKKIFVFGGMGELGQLAKSHHEYMGKLALELGIDEVFTFGELSALTSSSFGENGHHYNSQDELKSIITNGIQKDTTVLIKGSRAMKMENVVNTLLADN